MKIAGTYAIGASRDETFAALTDPGFLERVIPGCERMVKTGEDTYEAHLKVGVAGFKGTYTGQARLTDKRPPESYTLVVDGRGGPGFVRGSARIELVAKGPETELACQAEVQVGGVIAAVGSRLIEAAARKGMDDFFRSVNAELQKR